MTMETPHLAILSMTEVLGGPEQGEPDQLQAVLHGVLPLPGLRTGNMNHK